MPLLVLAYPQLEKKDFEWIQSFRSKYDERYYTWIEPHFTIVFPVEEVNIKRLTDHMEKASKKFKEFYFVLRCAQIVKDSFRDYTDLFLITEEGCRIFVKLHDTMYRGILEDELRLDISFIPHMGIANSRDPLTCEKLADEINSINPEVFGAVNKLDIVLREGEKVNPIKEIKL